MNLPSRSARGRRAPMADINVTPLVDVMLVLLIIFMVTAPLMTAGVPVNLPDSRAKALDEEAAARRVESYAGEPDPYKKPREDAGDEAEEE